LIEKTEYQGSKLSLREQIEAEIRERGPIPFSRYMEICLYDPVAGYYSRNAEQFGKAGDFYTSSDIHAVFGRLLARQFEEMWQALDRPVRLEILELGPGRGLFARDVLDWSRKKFPDFFAALTYTLQESSPALQAKLQETLSEHIASGKAAISVVETRPAASPAAEIRRKASGETPLLVFANEFFDALPVEVMSAEGKLHLALEANHLTEVWLPPANEELEFLDRHSIHPESRENGNGIESEKERVEVPLAAQGWLAQAANAIERGFLLMVDYGYTRSEQLAGRHRGTLMAYRQHSASANVYEAPGEQDLTAHVNFTALTAAAEHAGMRTERLITQSQFLLGIGEKTQFADAFEECRLPQERAKVALQLKHLVAPVGMGETFHVLVASRNVDAAKVGALSGLSFGVARTG
jgi:SAM-dependent MidA family methyltransferase